MTLSPRTSGLSAYSALPSRHSVLTHVGCPTVALYVASAPRVCSRLRHERAGSPQPSAESGSLSYGLPVHLRMLSTPPHGDAVSFDYRVATNSGTDSHRSVKASSRTHSSPRTRGPITTDANCCDLRRKAATTASLTPGTAYGSLLSQGRRSWE